MIERWPWLAQSVFRLPSSVKQTMSILLTDPLRMSDQSAESFATFGALLRFLRRRARITQRELGIAVGYSEAHIARLESDQRTPDPAVVQAQFIEALSLTPTEPLAQRMVALAEIARGVAAPSATPAAVSPGRLYRPPAEPSPPTNLRSQLTEFMGRKEGIVQAARLLADARLLTITGSGGVGKSRMAVQLAQQMLSKYPDGVWIVALAAVENPAHVAVAVAHALGVSYDEESALNALREYVRNKHMLIVLDNCEHLIAACAEVAVSLLQVAPMLTILATSREPLNVAGEVTWQLPTMSCEEAIQLFIEHARTIRQDFAMTDENAPILGRICEQLDGLPLAIELAASRLRVLSLEQIAERLDDRFHLLTGGTRLSQAKHQTLRTMIDWSYDLLTEQEKTLLKRLSKMPAGWTLEDAETRCSDDATDLDGRRHIEKRTTIRRSDILDLLTQLVQKSLVILDQDATPPRYRMLKTIRQYAKERLAEDG